jgi:hypothetical protein
MKNISIIAKVRAIVFIMILMAFILPIISACASASQTITSGISGKVMIGPISPVEKEGEVNEKPYPDALIFIMDASGKKKMKEVKSDLDGLFKVYLAPGTYLLVPQSPKNQALPVGEPQTVIVLENRFTDVTVNYDSGIR